MRVIHAVANGTEAYACHSLETGAEAIVVTTPIRRKRRVPSGECWFCRAGTGADKFKRIPDGKPLCHLCRTLLVDFRNYLAALVGIDRVSDLSPRDAHRDLGEGQLP